MVHFKLKIYKTCNNQHVKIYIKNMVCIRCIMVVKSELEKQGISFHSVELGEARIGDETSERQLLQLQKGLQPAGLQLLDDKRAILVENIKKVIIELVHYSEEPLSVNLSDYLSDKLGNNYKYMAALFSEVHGSTIEKFYIRHKIERVKELLVYDEFNLTEIARKMHYSSVAYLSAQFRKITGLTPSHFRKLRKLRRNMLNDF